MSAQIEADVVSRLPGRLQMRARAESAGPRLRQVVVTVIRISAESGIRKRIVDGQASPMICHPRVTCSEKVRSGTGRNVYEFPNLESA